MKRRILCATMLVACVTLIGCNSNEVKDINKQKGEHIVENVYSSERQDNKKAFESTSTADSKLHTTYLGEYFDNFWEGEDWPKYHSEGMFFGYPDNFWDGCSKWCAVWDFYSNVEASTTLKQQGKFTYDAANISSSSRDNAWVEGVEGDGIGEFLEIKQMCQSGPVGSEPDLDINFNELCIVNGYTATIRNWVENNRVRELKMYFNDEYVTNIELEDTMKPQYIDISSLNLKVKNGEEAKFKFEIVSVYKGEKYEDTAITGIEIDFSGPHH